MQSSYFKIKLYSFITVKLFTNLVLVFTSRLRFQWSCLSLCWTRESRSYCILEVSSGGRPLSWLMQTKARGTADGRACREVTTGFTGAECKPKEGSATSDW